MTPIDKELAEHVESVTVLIDAERGFILACQMIDADGERTVIRFSNVKTNTHLDDSRLRLNLPAEVKTVRPLENLGDPSGPKETPTPKSRQ
jgi:outer membrane lipoprotein-sorting protein